MFSHIMNIKWNVKIRKQMTYKGADLVEVHLTCRIADIKSGNV